MKKIIKSLLLSCALVKGAFAGHFYNIDSTDELRDGKDFNFQHHLGFSDDRQATLINPRLAVTVTHGHYKGQEQDTISSISFYGKQYPIIKAIEHPGMNGARNLERDLTLFVLGEDVVHPEGGAVCAPIAVINEAMPVPDATQTWYGHSLSRSPNLKLDSFYPPFTNTDFSTIYGKTKINIEHSRRAYSGHNYIETVRDHTSCDPTMMVPIGGDSGSPLYVSLATGGFAVFGALARTSGSWDPEQSKVGEYTSLSTNIEWIKQKEAELKHRGLLPDSLQGLTTVNQDQWKLTPNAFELPKVLSTFDPAKYLALNPDVKEAYKDLPFKEALEKARIHHDTRAVLEGRRTLLSQATADGTFDPMTYLALNYDLQGVFGNGTLSDALEQAARHHQTSGLREGRPYNLVNVRHDKSKLTLPENFYPNTYLHLNPDVAQAARMRGVDPHAFAIEHYTKTGFKEKGRRFMLGCPGDFDAMMYLYLNGDLKNAFLNESSFYYRSWTHYVSLGFLEQGRCYLYGEAPRTALVNGNFVMPRDFDPLLYLALNMPVFWDIKSQHFDATLGEMMTFAREFFERVAGPRGDRYR